MVWKCVCGRAWPETKSRCVECGERRPGAASAKTAAVTREPTPVADEGDMVLALYPLREVLPDAVKAFAASFGLGIYDARRRLEAPFPQVVGSGPPAEIDQLSRHLAAEGLACAKAPAAEIWKALVPRAVTRVASLSETALEVWGPEGSAIGAPIVPWTIDLRKPRLVVVGSSTLRAPGSDKKLRFVHVWHERDGRPYELVEKDLKQFDL